MSADRDSCNLLVAIARRPADPPRIRGLAEKVSDWDSLLGLAQEHRLSPMLYLSLADMGPSVPLAAQERLRSEYERNVFHNIASAAELIAVLRMFDRESISAMPFKGVVLASSVYSDMMARPGGDLDLLIHLHDLPQASSLLLNRGYRLKTEVRADGVPVDGNYYEYSFESEANGMVLELRWRLELAYGRFGRNLGMDWVWPHRRTVLLAGAMVPDLKREIALLILCMHASKHIWSRLIWICDVERLLASSPDLDWEETIREARRKGLWRCLALGVLLANRVLGAPVPHSVLPRFESDGAALRLAEHFEHNLFDMPGVGPSGRVPYNLQLLDFRDRIRLLLTLNLLQPNARDRAALSLPGPLKPLYYLLRPFRIFWDRSAR
ncbi:MAG: nucleotidyltransferase family protein [Terracidiphilus sp.]